MKIELKNLRTFASLSDETHCFSATLWVDGRKIGSIANHGQGGADEFHGDEKAFTEADVWCRDNLPEWSMPEAEGETVETFQTDLEMHVASLIDDHLALQDMRKALAKAVIYRKPGVAGLWQIRIEPSKDRTMQRITGVLRAEGVKEFLHEMPTEDALRAFREG